MPVPNIEDFTASLDQTALAYLGEPITYVPAGQPTLTLQAHVNYADMQTDLGAGQAIEQDMMLTIAKSDLAQQPRRDDRIELSKRPGKVYYPTNPSTDESGTHWVVALKEVK